MKEAPYVAGYVALGILISIVFPALICRLPVNSVHCKLEVSGHTTAQEASDAQE